MSTANSSGTSLTWIGHIDFDLLDAGGVLHHPNYLVLCERARIEGLKSLGLSFYDFWKNKESIAVVEIQCAYRRPARGGQRILIQTDFYPINRKMLTAKQVMWDSPGDLEKKTLLFEAELKLIAINLESFRAQNLPPSLEAILLGSSNPA